MKQTQALQTEACSGTHDLGGRRPAGGARCSQAREILMGYQEQSCHCEGVQTLDPPDAVGSPALRILKSHRDKSLSNLI